MRFIVVVNPTAPKNSEFDYLVEISTRWHGRFFHFVSKYAYPGPNTTSPFFENFAAHNSEKAGQTAAKAIGGDKIGSVGSWLKKQNRLKELTDSLKSIANNIENNAPY